MWQLFKKRNKQSILQPPRSFTSAFQFKPFIFIIIIWITQIVAQENKVAIFEERIEGAFLFAKEGVHLLDGSKAFVSGWAFVVGSLFAMLEDGDLFPTPSKENLLSTRAVHWTSPKIIFNAVVDEATRRISCHKEKKKEKRKETLEPCLV